jgi:hypothetical protein
MKLLIIVCLAEDKHEVSKLLQQSGVAVFSVTSTTGYKRNNGQPNLLDNWFGKDNTEFNSIFFFCFTDEASAAAAIEAVNQRNENNKSQFPLHGFTLPVEMATQL